jgi:O-antigen ligase
MRVMTGTVKPSYKISPKSRTWPPLGMVLFLLYAWICVGRPQEIVPQLIVLRLGLLTGGLALLAWLHAPGRFAEKISLDTPRVRDVMILVGLAVITVPVSIWPAHSILFLFNVFLKTVLLFFLVIYWCRTVHDVRRLLWVYCLGTVCLVIPGVLSGPLGKDRYALESLSYDSNDIALLQVMALPLILYLYSTSGRRARLVLAGMATLCLYGIILTQSRGGFLALVVVGGLILWRSSLGKSAKWSIVMLGVVVFGILAGTAWKERIRTMWDPQTEYDQTAGGRTDLWKSSLVLLAKRPWGVGIDNFVTAEGLSHGGLGKWSAPHNSFFQIGVELGVVGLAIFIRLLARTLRSLRLIKMSIKPPKLPIVVRRLSERQPRASAREMDESGHLYQLAEALEMTLWGFIIAGFFLSQGYSGMLYVMLALGIVLTRLAKLTDVSTKLLWRRTPKVAFNTARTR